MTTERRNPHTIAACAELKKHGAIVLGVDWTHTHPRINFRFRGRARFYVTAGTPSCSGKTLHKVRADIRHLLGVKRRIVKTTRPATTTKKMNNRRPPPLSPETLTPGRDYFSILGQHTHLQRETHRRAWERYWADLKRELGIAGPWWEKP